MTFSFLYNQVVKSDSSVFPYYCSSKAEERPQVCTMEYLGVCGWFYKNVTCIKYPCAITSSTSCTACSNTNVEYVTLGDCPTNYEMLVNKTYQIPYLCTNQDRTQNCTLINSDSKVCAVPNSCLNKSNCGYISKPCEACLDSNVSILNNLGTCNGNAEKLSFSHLLTLALVLIYFLL